MSLLAPAEKTTIWEGASNNLLQFAEQNWKKGCFNDVTIKTDNETIAANRMVLASASLYFEKLFKTEMKEKYQRTFELQDVNGGSLRVLIEFIYSGKITTSNKNVLNLLSTADYLQIDKAKELCFEFLQSLLTADTCFAILSVANFYQHDQLQREALECIAKNFGYAEFSCDLSKSDLLVCISKMKENHAEESNIYQTIVSWIKFDEVKRIQEFQELLFLVNFDKLTVDFIQKVMLVEELIIEISTCLKYVIKKLTDRSTKEQMKQRGGTKAISIGGSNTTNKVIEVYNCFSEPPIEHPAIPLNSGSECKFAENLAGSIYICILERNILFKDETKVWKLNLDEATSSWKFIAQYSHDNAQRLMINDDCWVDVASQTLIKFHLSPATTWIDGTNQQRINHQLVSCRGCLYALGGSADDLIMSSVKQLSATGKQQDGKGNRIWQSIHPMQKPRMHFAAVNCGDIIYAIGGDSGATIMKSVEKYDTTIKEWTYVSNMQFKRQKHAACVVDGKIVVVGGLNSSGDAIHEIECYDPPSDTWSIVGKTQDKLYNHSLVSV